MTANDAFSVKKVSFYKSLKLRSQTPIVPRPEIAIAGKSNSGKSSLINYLCGRKRLAYVGKQPGKTRLVNYFVINDSFYLVDLPGYGFAKVSKNELAAWSQMMDAFFLESQELLRGLLICTDIRRDPSAQDIQMIEWALHYHVPQLVIATKCDKIAKSKRPQYVARISKVIGESLSGTVKIPVCAVSSADRIGADMVLVRIGEMLGRPELES